VSDSPTLVLLAAGAGRRFGGLKQLAPIGPSGEAMMDLTVADAAAAGFGDVVLIVRHSIADELREHVERRSALPVRLAYQDDLPPARAKPWGTAHALVSAAPLLHGPFGVANADDYYDVDGVSALAQWVRERRRPGAACIVAYRLGDTLSDQGTVSRGICEVNPRGALVRCEEHLRIERGADGVVRSEHGPLADDAAASMNLFGFDETLVTLVRREWERWIAIKSTDPEDECRLPEVLNDLVARGEATVDVVRTSASWMGITYTADLEPARAALAYRFTSS
jgi:NDP-sugar pyrophosphorylase family protein